MQLFRIFGFAILALSFCFCSLGHAQVVGDVEVEEPDDDDCASDSCWKIKDVACTRQPVVADCHGPAKIQVIDKRVYYSCPSISEKTTGNTVKKAAATENGEAGSQCKRLLSEGDNSDSVHRAVICVRRYQCKKVRPALNKPVVCRNGKLLKTYYDFGWEVYGKSCGGAGAGGDVEPVEVDNPL